MELTGHPLVDVGFAIATLHSQKHSISELTENDLQQCVMYLNSLLDPSKNKPGPLNNLKVLSAFWQNNPLAGHNMGTNGQNVPIYRDALINAVQSVKKPRKGCCQICGRNSIYKDANRSWLPLGASSDGDPCSLPNLSGKFICTACFIAIVLLPLGCKFIGSNPYIFHVTDPEVLCEATEIGFDAVKRQIIAKTTGNENLKTQVRLSGRVALLEIIAGSRLWDITQGGKLTKRLPTGATLIAFSNAGTSAAWYQLHLPAQALEFFAELDSAEQQPRSILRDTFLKWAQVCEKPEYTDKDTKAKRTNPYFDALCDDIEQRRSLGLLVRAIVRQRKPTLLNKEEKQVLEIYERVALSKQERFDLLVGIANRVRNEMEDRYRESFRKQLANIRSKEKLLNLLKGYRHSEKTGFHVTVEELRMIDSENASEIISLLYLLIMAQE